MHVLHPVSRGTKKVMKKSSVMLLVLVLPFVLFIFAFYYVPLLGWILAFFNYKPGIPLSRTPFVGLKYFQMMFSGGSDMLRSLRNTFAMYLLGLLCTPLPMIFAILLNEIRCRPFKKIVQTTTTMPNFISWIIVFSFAFSLFSTDGLVNNLLTKLHLISTPTNLLGNSDIVWVFQTLLGLWKGLGWSAIIYIAAIAGIDGELYDAARVDGAGRFRCTLHITIPGLMPTFLVLLLLSLSNILSVGFDQYLLFYNSLVADKIEVLDYYVYRLGIVASNYSYGTAVGIFKSVVSITMLFLINYIAKRVRGSSLI